MQPNEVTYTALIKGLCQDGRIGEALESLQASCDRSISANADDCPLWQAMRDAEAAPNLRTFNTLLRGCLRAFDADSAERVFAVSSASELLGRWLDSMLMNDLCWDRLWRSAALRPTSRRLSTACARWLRRVRLC